jgi:hypothetical protein
MSTTNQLKVGGIILKHHDVTVSEYISLSYVYKLRNIAPEQVVTACVSGLELKSCEYVKKSLASFTTKWEGGSAGIS